MTHYLPIAHWPEFTVFSWNLVPSCPCNDDRGDRISYEGTPTPPLHPYFDDHLTDLAFLEIEMDITGAMPAFFAGVNLPDGVILDDDRDRLAAHLKNSISTTHLTQWLSVELLCKLRAASEEMGSVAELADHVEFSLRIELRANRKNSWAAGFYRHLLANPEKLEWVFETRNAGKR